MKTSYISFFLGISLLLSEISDMQICKNLSTQIYLYMRDFEIKNDIKGDFSAQIQGFLRDIFADFMRTGLHECLGKFFVFTPRYSENFWRIIAHFAKIPSKIPSRSGNGKI